MRSNSLYKVFQFIVDLFFLRKNMGINHYKNIQFKITTSSRVIHIFAIQMTLTCIAHIER